MASITAKQSTVRPAASITRRVPAAVSRTLAIPRSAIPRSDRIVFQGSVNITSQSRNLVR